jgi:hypothetical protein
MRVNTSILKISTCTVLEVVAIFLVSGPAGAQTSSGTNSAKLAADLEARAKQYLDFRKKVAGTSPSSTATPAKITSAQRELANKIRVARAGAKQGTVFTPEISEYVRKQIALSLDGRDGGHIRASLRHSEPVNITLQINQSYPDNTPLQSTPPSLLLSLPELPAGLEYRLVGRELVLRDVDANIVVDYVANALPNGG